MGEEIQPHADPGTMCSRTSVIVEKLQAEQATPLQAHQLDLVSTVKVVAAVTHGSRFLGCTQAVYVSCEYYFCNYKVQEDTNRGEGMPRQTKSSSFVRYYAFKDSLHVLNGAHRHRSHRTLLRLHRTLLWLLRTYLCNVPDPHYTDTLTGCREGSESRTAWWTCRKTSVSRE